MLISFVRTVILYFLIVIALRIMGKRQIGQLEPAELVVTMMISDLAAIPIGHVSIPLLHGIIPVMTLILLESVISFLNLKSRAVRKFIAGVPVIIIQNGKVLEKELIKLRLNIDDLMEELRVSGYPDITEIAYAVFETNGNLSVIPKEEFKPLTLHDIGKSAIDQGLPFLFVCDGEVNQSALKLYQKNEKWLIKKLTQLNLETKNTLLAGVDEKGLFYAQKRKCT